MSLIDISDSIWLTQNFSSPGNNIPSILLVRNSAFSVLKFQTSDYHQSMRTSPWLPLQTDHLLPPSPLLPLSPLSPCLPVLPLLSMCTTATRVFFKKPKSDYAIPPRKILQWLPISLIIKAKDLTMTKNILQDLDPRTPPAIPIPHPWLPTYTLI